MSTRAETAFLQAEGKSSEIILERARSELLRLGAPSGGAKILDLGCGKGDFLRRLLASGQRDLHGCDG